MYNVMVVEDNVDFRETLCKALQKHLPDVSFCEIGNGRRVDDSTCAWTHDRAELRDHAGCDRVAVKDLRVTA